MLDKEEADVELTPLRNRLVFDESCKEGLPYEEAAKLVVNGFGKKELSLMLKRFLSCVHDSIHDFLTDNQWVSALCSSVPRALSRIPLST
jgi:hypothetical protein